VRLDEIVQRAGRVAVLMGGPSAEHEISVRSGEAVFEALRRSDVDASRLVWDGDLLEQIVNQGYDRAFVALHGRGGEDGQVQGLLDILGIPYTGSGVLGCALSMDKTRAKQVWRSMGFPTPEFKVVGEDLDIGQLVRDVGLPMMIKPAREGSSIGMSRVESTKEIDAAIKLAREYDGRVLAERCIEGNEYTLSIVNGRALPIIKLETPRAFYDYEAKYVADTTRYICPSGLDEKTETECADLGMRAFEALGADGWGRLDFLTDEDGRPWFIDLNTVPGLTDHSLVPMAAAAVGISFDELVLHILGTSFSARD